MKTEVIIYRDLNGVKIRQNHKTAYLNANDLLDLYNSTAEKKKDMFFYFKLKSTKEFIIEVQKDILQNTDKNKDLVKLFDIKEENTVDKILGDIQEENSNNGDSLYLENSLIITKRGKNGGTWLHPYLFIDFALWLSPAFRLTCIKWLYDKLIIIRDQCGDSFKEVNQALFELKPNTPPWEYSNEAKMINKLVFDKPDKGQRNDATEEQLALLKALQKADIKLIQEGKDYYERFEKLKQVRQIFLLSQ